MAQGELQLHSWVFFRTLSGWVFSIFLVDYHLKRKGAVSYSVLYSQFLICENHFAY